MPASPRRWYQFRLRTLLAMVLVVAIGMSWFAAKMHKARVQRQAVEAIVKVEGTIEYDNQSTTTYGMPPESTWLRQTLGNDFFNSVTGVTFFHYEQVSNEDLRHVAAFPELEDFVLIEGRVTDEGLTHLNGLTNLKRLRLVDVPITDAGLARLRLPPHLENLDFSGTQVTDAGLAYLNGLAQLRVLELERALVTDAGLAHLEGLQQLEVLNLSVTWITDGAVPHLVRLKNLKLLRLGGTLLTKAGEQQLEQGLSECQVTWWARSPN